MEILKYERRKKYIWRGKIIVERKKPRFVGTRVTIFVRTLMTKDNFGFIILFYGTLINKRHCLITYEIFKKKIDLLINYD